jgi:NitT/TauT family transport system permease protein
MNNLLSLITPNACINKSTRSAIIFGWIVVTLLIWQFVDIRFLPKPTEILNAFETLRQNGTFLEFGTSIWTMMEAIFWTVAISLSLAYLSVLPILEPFVKFITGLRYLGLVGLMLAFTLIAPDGHALKVMVLTFGMTVFYLRDMLSIVQAIPQEEYDHAETLGMSQIRIIYEVIVLGTLDEALESLRVNAAMGWMMLTMVEGIVRSEGGIGTVLINMNRHMDLPATGAILISLFCVGIIQDFLIGMFRNYIACPYANLGKGRG